MFVGIVDSIRDSKVISRIGARVAYLLTLPYLGFIFSTKVGVHPDLSHWGLLCTSG